MRNIVDPVDGPIPFRKLKQGGKMSSGDIKRLNEQYAAANRKFAELLAKSDQAMRNTLLAISGQIHNMEDGLILMPVQRRHVEFLRLLQTILQGKELPRRIGNCEICKEETDILDIPLPPGHGVFCSDCAKILHNINNLLHAITDEQRKILTETWDLDIVGKMNLTELDALKVRMEEMIKENE